MPLLNLNRFHTLTPLCKLYTCLALALLMQGCSTVSVSPSRSTSSSAPATVSTRSPQSAAVGADIALFAMSLLESRYTYGGKGPATGFDCSGLVTHVYRQGAGIDFRGSSAQMAQKAKSLDGAPLQAGDLLFFNTLGPSYSHVGVYVGNGKFIHAANERSGVRMDRLSDRYYAARFEGAKTVLD